MKRKKPQLFLQSYFHTVMQGKILSFLKFARSGILIYTPQLLFNFFAPIYILIRENSSQNLLIFYAITFGIGLLTSGFSNASQYIIRARKANLSVFEFFSFFVATRLVLLILVLALSPSFIFYGIVYDPGTISALILASLPNWSFLFLIGLTRSAIFAVWAECIAKVGTLIWIVEYDKELWPIVYLIAFFSSICTASVLAQERRIRKFSATECVKLMFPFFSGGVLFALSWLVFMSSVVSSAIVGAPLIVFLERTLRILERVSSIASVILLRKHGTQISDGIRNRIIVANSQSLPFVVVLYLLSLFVNGPAMAIFLISIVNVFMGHLVQQLVAPNSLYSYGAIIQSLLLIIPWASGVQNVECLMLFFSVGCFGNFLIRRWSLQGK